jgi:hypothetical protein
LIVCPSSPSSLGEVPIIVLIALALVALTFFAPLVVVVFTALAVAICRCLLSAVIARLLAAHLLSTGAGAAAASRPRAEPLLPLVALYFIMADYYAVALAPTPSSYCPSCCHHCHCIMIVSHPATLTKESIQKNEKAEKVYF